MTGKGIETVIVMENDDTQRNAMVETLDKLGYEVKGSKSAIDVAELVNSGKFDMCILDIHMGDGQDNAGLKVLVL